MTKAVNESEARLMIFLRDFKKPRSEIFFAALWLGGGGSLKFLLMKVNTNCLKVSLAGEAILPEISTLFIF